MKKIGLVFFLLSALNSFTHAQDIYTFAGDGVAGYSGDGGIATIAELSQPTCIAIDTHGNVYIADQFNKRIRKVTTTGIISTVAGNGIRGYSGDSGQATAAELNYPSGITVDDSGNIFIADFYNYRIRKVTTKGIIYTIAGDSTQGYSGDGGAATAAELSYPSGVALDAKGNIYIADMGNNRIRIVNKAGVINTIAGNGNSGYSGDGGLATAAELNSPYGLTVDIFGNIYIADNLNNRIRKINNAGIISTIAGNGTAGYSGDGIVATMAELYSPFGVSVDSLGDIYIADEINNRIRKINSTGIISTIAGNGTQGYSGDGGPATAAEINSPPGVAVDASGNIYIADYGNQRVRKINSTVGINELFSTKSVQVFPNPSKGTFTFQIASSQQLMGNSHLEVYNMLGQKIADSQWPSANSSMQIDISKQSAGIYLYRIISEKGESLSSEKLIVD